MIMEATCEIYRDTFFQYSRAFHLIRVFDILTIFFCFKEETNRTGTEVNVKEPTIDQLSIIVVKFEIDSMIQWNAIFHCYLSSNKRYRFGSETLKKLQSSISIFFHTEERYSWNIYSDNLFSTGNKYFSFFLYTPWEVRKQSDNWLDMNLKYDFKYEISDLYTGSQKYLNIYHIKLLWSYRMSCIKHFEALIAQGFDNET